MNSQHTHADKYTWLFDPNRNPYGSAHVQAVRYNIAWRRGLGRVSLVNHCTPAYDHLMISMPIKIQYIRRWEELIPTYEK